MPSGASRRGSSAKLNGSWESRLANNVNFSFEFIEGEGMLLQLADRGICVSSGSACTSGSLDRAMALAIGLPTRSPTDRCA